MSTIRSHSGGLALPRCNHFLGNPRRGWQSLYIECVTLEDDPCGPLQPFLGAGHDCGIPQSFSSLPPLQSFPRKQGDCQRAKPAAPELLRNEADVFQLSLCQHRGSLDRGHLSLKAPSPLPNGRHNVNVLAICAWPQPLGQYKRHTP